MSKKIVLCLFSTSFVEFFKNMGKCGKISVVKQRKENFDEKRRRSFIRYQSEHLYVRQAGFHPFGAANAGLVTGGKVGG